jgi:hypothetical protein
MVVSLNNVSEEVLYSILSCMNPEELGKSSRVSKVWNRIANDETLWKAFYPKSAFGKEKWAKHFGDIGEELPLPHSIHKILKNPCPFLKGFRIEDTHLLVLIPETLNGEPLSFDRLQQRMQQLKPDDSMGQFHSCEVGKTKAFGKSHWVLMFKQLIPASRNQCYADLVKLLSTYNKNQATYRFPRVAEAVTCIFAEYVNSGVKILFGSLNAGGLLSYTYCAEQSYKKHAVVGGVTSTTGLSIQFWPVDRNSFLGIAPVREISLA